MKRTVFSAVILLLSLHFLQISAHSKSDADEVALSDYICLNALLRERLHVNKCCTGLNHAFTLKYLVSEGTKLQIT